MLHWQRNGIRLYTKLKVYKAVVLSTLLYACETWTPSQTLRRRSHTHRNLVSAICTMRQICDTKAIDCDINKTILRLNCEKIISHERRGTLARMSHECLTTVVRGTHSRGTLARMYHDCREIHAPMSHDCRKTLARMSHDNFMCVVITMSSETAMRKLSKSRVYFADLCLQLANLSRLILALHSQQRAHNHT